MQSGWHGRMVCTTLRRHGKTREAYKDRNQKEQGDYLAEDGFVPSKSSLACLFIRKAEETHIISLGISRSILYIHVTMCSYMEVHY